MNHRDVWFVGLLALAYLYLDATGPAYRRATGAQQATLPSGEDSSAGEPFVLPIADACPRDLSHPIRLRDDGAKWCLSCDEAFYPVAI